MDGSENNPIDSLNYRVLEQYIYILGCDVTGLTRVDIPTVIYGKGMQKFCDWFTTESYMQGNRERDKGANYPSASRSKRPHNTQFFKVWGLIK